MTDNDLNWRVEEACRAAWPAAIEEKFPGWVMRRSGGAIRRTNSVNPLPGQRLSVDEMSELAETFYAGFGQMPIIRIVTFGDQVAAAFERRGYSKHGETCTWFADISNTNKVENEDVELSVAASAEWLGLRHRIVGDRPIFEQMLASIAVPKQFALSRVDGKVGAIAYAAIHRELLIIEAVATDPAMRNRGLAKRTVGALLNWGRGQGIAQAGLQVVADNHPARAVYSQLGFNRELYRYHYLYGPMPA